MHRGPVPRVRNRATKRPREDTYPLAEIPMGSGPNHTPEQDPMQDPSLITGLSRDRLGGYSVKGGLNSDADLLGRYLLNLAVSNAFYPYFHTLEVVLRNRIYQVVSADNSIDPDRPDLYESFPCWLDSTPTLFVASHQKLIDEAKTGVNKALRKRYGATAGGAKRLRTPGRLVAQLTFSFWVFLFDPEYCGDGRTQGMLWPRYIVSVFPHRPLHAGLKHIRKELRRLLVVRNRIMHYERVVPWEHESTALDPLRIRNDILTLLDWMEPSISRAMREHLWDEPFLPEYQRHLRWMAHRLLAP